MKRVFIIMTLLSAFLPVGSEGKKEIGTENPVVYVSILPQAYLLERVVGDSLEVEVMVPPGKSPATYEPTPQQVVGLGAADIFFTLGVPFETSFLPSIRSSIKGLSLIDSSTGIERRYLEAHHHDEEEHHHEEEEEGTEDPHLWLSPVYAKILASNMAEEIIKKYPAQSTTYQNNLKSLLRDLDDLDRELTEILKPVAGEVLFVFHPSFGYFADRYNLIQEAIELEGKEPSPADLEMIINEAKDEGVRIILVQPEFSQSSAQAVAEAINGSVIPVETLSGDYINNLRNLALQIKKGLE